MLRFCSALLFLLSLNFSYSQTKIYQERFRPQFHFSPAIHWMNDPNGLVYHDGEYHLFYQYNPLGIRWGHMSWGHAISEDLIHWQHLPLAIAEEKDTMIFSGSCVVDKNNSSGFAEKTGQTPLVAIYTGHIEGKNQSQHLAYSNDSGRTWKKYGKNPMLDLGKKDFRDPQVFWYEPQKKWIMIVALPIERQVQFYQSTNLKDWTLMSSFGPAGDISGIWECPDLFEVPIKDEPGKTKWVLMLSPAPYMQHFIGEFDGTTFINESNQQKIFRPDYGPDYYAAITYKNLPPGKDPISIGWVNNWNYAQDIPTSPWRSIMSLPRTLGVKKINGEWTLLQSPIESYNTLRSSIIGELKNVIIENSNPVPSQSQQCEIIFTIEPGKNTRTGIRIAVGDSAFAEIGYDITKQSLYIDRSKAGIRSFHPEFDKLSRFETKLSLQTNRLSLQVIFDNSVVEVFANDGEAVMTFQLFPQSNQSGIEVFSDGGQSRLVELSLRKMIAAW